METFTSYSVGTSNSTLFNPNFCCHLIMDFALFRGYLLNLRRDYFTTFSILIKTDKASTGVNIFTRLAHVQCGSYDR